MGKGVAKRRRQQRAERANSSNLFKAQFGKALPYAPLPDAPKENEAENDKVPASLRKLMKLQEAATKQEARKQAKLEKQEHAATVQEPLQKTSRAQQAPAAQQLQHELTGNPQQQQQPEQQHGGGSEQQQHVKKGKPAKELGKPQVEERIYMEGAFDQVKHKRLKDKKREFLERKKQRKKAGQKAFDASGLTPAELKLKKQQAETQAKFGEVADAPLKVQLKRKHWATQQQTQETLPNSSTGPSAPSARLTKIFKAQMSAAEQRMQGGAVQQQGRVSRHAGIEPTFKQQKRVQNDSAQPRIGLLQQAKQKAAAAAAAADRERVRQQVMAAYRQNKQSAAGKANMQTLAALVQKNAVAAAATAAQLQ